MSKYLLLLLLISVAAFADATKEIYTKLKMVAGMMETEQSTKSEIRTQMKSEYDVTTIHVPLVGAKTSHKTTITRIDKGVYWTLDHDKKTWSEDSIKMPEVGAETKASTPGQADTVKDYRVIKSELTVRKLDSTKTINGFPCIGYVATWTLVTEKTKTKEQSTSIMTLTEWTTTPTDAIKQAQADEDAFNKALAARLGLVITTEQGQLLGTQYLTTLGMSDKEMQDKLKTVGSELSKIQGYPIVTEVKWNVPGDTAVKNKPESEPPQSPGPTSLSGLMNKALQAKLTPKPTEPSLVFSSYLEVKSIKVGAVADNDFEVPAGYKRK